MKHSISETRAAATALAAGAALLLAAGSAQAQDTDLGLGVFGGGYISTDLTSYDGSQFFEDGTPADLQFQASGLVGLQGEYWISDRFALRAGGGFSPATLELDQPDEVPSPDPGDGAEVADGNVWMADVNGILAILPEDNTVTPFVTAGAGVVAYNFDGSDAIVVDEANARIPDREEIATGNDATQLAGMLGVGVDVQPEGWPVAIRGELNDHISGSPAELFLGDEDILPGGADVEGDNDFGTVHNLRLSLGLQWFPGEG